MKLEEHQEEVKKLTNVELELIEMISETGSNELMEKFNQWQDQRIICNEGYAAFIDNLTKSIPKTERNYKEK